MGERRDLGKVFMPLFTALWAPMGRPLASPRVTRGSIRDPLGLPWGGLLNSMPRLAFLVEAIIVFFYPLLSGAEPFSVCKALDGF